MAEASVGQATAGETGCASSCEENKCTSVNEVLYQTIANIKLIKCNTGQLSKLFSVHNVQVCILDEVD